MMQTILANAPWPQFVFIPQPVDRSITRLNRPLMLSEKIESYLSENPDSYSPDIAEAVGKKTKTVVEKLRQMVVSELLTTEDGDRVAANSQIMKTFRLKEKLQ